jgi:hypothetical protein
VNSGLDSSGNLIIKPTITPTDVLNIHLTDFYLNVYYNDLVVTPLNTIVFDKSQIIDCSFHLKNLDREFFALQYVGTISCELSLQTPENSIYDFTLKGKYTYDTAMSNKMDAFETGIYTNLKESEQTHFRCVLDSTAPTFVNGSFISYEDAISSTSV